MTNPAAIAKLRFHKITRDANTDDWGEIVLTKSGAVRLYAGAGLRSRLLRTADRVDRATLMYGATAFIGCAAVGATLVARRKTVWGFVWLLIAGLVALGGSGVRRVAKRAPRLFDTAFAKSDVAADLSPEGGLTITLADKPWKGTALRFEAGEFDLGQATAFIAALRR